MNRSTILLHLQEQKCFRTVGGPDLATFRGKIWEGSELMLTTLAWVNSKGVGDDLLQWLLKNLWEILQ